MAEIDVSANGSSNIANETSVSSTEGHRSKGPEEPASIFGYDSTMLAVIFLSR